MNPKANARQREVSLTQPQWARPYLFDANISKSTEYVELGGVCLTSRSLDIFAKGKKGGPALGSWDNEDARKEQKMRSYPESNRGRRNVIDVIRIRSDNRYTIKPKVLLYPSMEARTCIVIIMLWAKLSVVQADGST
ncbi:hypothetical protein Q7P37_001501 [Cladosporium fusiforme]